MGEGVINDYLWYLIAYCKKYISILSLSHEIDIFLEKKAAIDKVQRMLQCEGEIDFPPLQPSFDLFKK